MLWLGFGGTWPKKNPDSEGKVRSGSGQMVPDPKHWVPDNMLLPWVFQRPHRCRLTGGLPAHPAWWRSHLRGREPPPSYPHLPYRTGSGMLRDRQRNITGQATEYGITGQAAEYYGSESGILRARQRNITGQAAQYYGPGSAILWDRQRITYYGTQSCGTGAAFVLAGV